MNWLDGKDVYARGCNNIQTRSRQLDIEFSSLILHAKYRCIFSYKKFLLTKYFIYKRRFVEQFYLILQLCGHFHIFIILMHITLLLYILFVFKKYRSDVSLSCLVLISYMPLRQNGWAFIIYNIYN